MLAFGLNNNKMPWWAVAIVVSTSRLLAQCLAPFYIQVKWLNFVILTTL